MKQELVLEQDEKEKLSFTIDELRERIGVYYNSDPDSKNEFIVVTYNPYDLRYELYFVEENLFTFTSESDSKINPNDGWMEYDKPLTFVWEN